MSSEADPVAEPPRAGAGSRLGRAIAIIFGAGDYEAHLRHAAAKGHAPLSRGAFDRRRLEARYGRSSHRCC
ncbi:YbdD/YjiX family protein [Sphingomonas sp. HF-S3]|uniref:YbdD/YjiX family protein n=1 Tax=Sphingomonas rustica TaxID=3103142 RepID=A0ABV0B2I4_9SPHN